MRVAHLSPEQAQKLAAAVKAEGKLRRSTAKAAEDVETRDAAIHAAVQAGVRPAVIARGLKLSSQRILQINKGAEVTP